MKYYGRSLLKKKSRQIACSSIIITMIIVSWKEVRSGHVSIEDFVDASIQGVEDYIKRCKERLIRATSNSIDNINKTTKTRETEMGRKTTVWIFHATKSPGEISHEKTWTWLRRGNLKRETESLLIVAQNNAIRTNYIKAKIDNTQKIASVDYVMTKTKQFITW